MADYKLKKGFDLKVAGKADLKLVELDAPKKAAILPGDFLGLKPKMEVEEGEVVKIGSPLFHDKNNEKIKFSSPVSGKVLAINRGDRRKIVEVVIENDSKNESEKFMVVKADTVGSLKKEDIVENLLKSGMWPLLRQRPFNKIANPDVEPRDIFISAMDTAPLAADVNFIMKDEADDFQLGIDILAKLTTGKVYLSINGKADNLSALKNAKNAEINTFSGPHPAGNVGVHIHHIKPIKSGDKIWYLQPYAVALIGKFFRTGQYPNTRIIATAGTALNERQYYKVTLGTPIASLISEGNINHPEARFVSGNVLTGRKVSAAGYTGFYDNLISVIPEGPKERKLFGWYRLGLKTRSFNRSFLSAWVGPKEYEVNTLINGGKRAFVATGDYEKVIPMDIYPVYLIKSILAEDIVEMEGLGILEVDEEDVALCSYICPSKFDFGGILRQGLDLVEKKVNKNIHVQLAKVYKLKFLNDLLEKQKPLFEKGGKLEKFYPLWEAQETILLWTNARTKSGPHVRDGLDTKRFMMTVVVALLPATLFGMYNVGFQHFKAIGVQGSFGEMFGFGALTVLPIILVSYIVGGLWEVIFAVVRKHEVNEGFLVTGLLFPLTLPPTIPLWQVAAGITFGTVIGKEVFGGTGMNILNPALTARAFVFFAYPGRISGDKVWTAIDTVKDKVIDGFSGATPLLVASSTEVGHSSAKAVTDAGFSVMDMFLGFIPGSIGETSTLAILIGAFLLIILGVGSWRIMISVIAGGLFMGYLMNFLAGPESSSIISLPGYLHLIMGGFAFGLVFMATDPVSASQTDTGKYIYGFFIGLLAVLIRAVNPAYPEGMMLAILFMNVFAPLIDYYVVRANIKRRLSRA